MQSGCWTGEARVPGRRKVMKNAFSQPRSMEAPTLPFVIPSSSTRLRQVARGMNSIHRDVITTTTSNESASLAFVIPSAAEGSAVSLNNKRSYDGRAEISRRWRSRASFPMNSCGT
jgi:hypothetical protein